MKVNYVPLEREELDEDIEDEDLFFDARNGETEKDVQVGTNGIPVRVFLVGVIFCF